MTDKVQDQPAQDQLGTITADEKKRADAQKVITSEFKALKEQGIRNQQAVVKHVSGFAQGYSADTSVKEEEKE